MPDNPQTTPPFMRKEEIEAKYEDVFQKDFAIADYALQRMDAGESVEWFLMRYIVESFREINKDCGGDICV